jgi:hypothetical protein
MRFFTSFSMTNKAFQRIVKTRGLTSYQKGGFTRILFPNLTGPFEGLKTAQNTLKPVESELSVFEIKRVYRARKRPHQALKIIVISIGRIS